MAGFAIYNANDATTTIDARWQTIDTTYYIYTIKVPDELDESAPKPSINGHRYWRRGVLVPNENKPRSKGLRIIIIKKPSKKTIEARKISRPRAPPDKYNERRTQCLNYLILLLLVVTWLGLVGYQIQKMIEIISFLLLIK